jgi:hypothetical protein|tara:strand:- start:163 stop:576 length:414 start_codon:yes stop_codon:yes gene_type:complete
MSIVSTPYYFVQRKVRHMYAIMTATIFLIVCASCGDDDSSLTGVSEISLNSCDINMGLVGINIHSCQEGGSAVAFSCNFLAEILQDSTSGFESSAIYRTEPCAPGAILTCPNDESGVTMYYYNLVDGETCESISSEN